MQHKFSRTALLIGTEGLTKLHNSKVAVFGIGGVGSYTVEALVRAGVGSLLLVDFDEICLTNVNRQLHALHSTVGEYKVDVMKKRALDINPQVKVDTLKEFYNGKNSYMITEDLDYVVDAIDTVSGKVGLIKASKEKAIPVVSAMGAGNQLDPTGYVIVDISETKVCPLAREVRKKLRREAIYEGVKVVYNPAPPLKPKQEEVQDCKENCICPSGDAHCSLRNTIPGSISFVPPVVGLYLASVVVNELLGELSRHANGRDDFFA